MTQIASILILLTMLILSSSGQSFLEFNLQSYKLAGNMFQCLAAPFNIAALNLEF